MFLHFASWKPTDLFTCKFDQCMYIHVFEHVTCPQKANLNTIKLRVATWTWLIFPFDLSILDGSKFWNFNMKVIKFFVMIATCLIKELLLGTLLHLQIAKMNLECFNGLYRSVMVFMLLQFTEWSSSLRFWILFFFL